MLYHNSSYSILSSLDRKSKWSVSGVMVYCMAVVITMLPSSALAAGFSDINEGEFDITFDAGFGGAPITANFDIEGGSVPVLGAGQGTPVLDERTVLANQGDQSSYTFGGAALLQPSLAGVLIAPETGVSQFAPSGLNGPAELEIEIDEFEFDSNGGILALIASYTFTLEGFVGDGGFVSFSLDFELDTDVARNPVTGMQLGSFEDGFLGFSWVNDTPGPFRETFSDSVLLTGDLPLVELEVEGGIVFAAKNDNGASSIGLVDFTLASQAVPEPGACLLSLSALSFLAIGRRRVSHDSE